MSIQIINKESSRNVFLDITRGLYPDCESVHMFGFNRSVGTSYETIFNNGGGIYTTPASAVVMSLVSTSGSDTMGVLISGLDSSYNKISETVILSGTTPVTTTKSFLRINNAQITTGENIGNINITNGGTTYAYIEAGYGISQNVHYTVPAGFSLYISQVDTTSGTIGSNKYGFMRAKLKIFGGATLHFFESTFVTSQLKYDIPIPYRIPEKSDFSIECKSSSSTNEFTVYVGSVLMDD